MQLLGRRKLRHIFQLFFFRTFRQAGETMRPRFATLAGEQSGDVLRTVCLLVVGLLSATALSQVHIRVINANTNQPIKDERLNVALAATQIGSVAMATDDHGIIAVNTKKATTIRILSNMYADCRPRGELYTDYSIAAILSTGITTGNLCSTAAPKAKPGELILFEIPKTYIPGYPAPPLPPPPHSN
jgi:hypothetical protein